MKIKNRLIAGVLCLLMVFSCVSGLTSCNDDHDHDHDQCTHQWGDWSTTKKATCTDAGTKERTCADCGEKETSTISALGHDWTEANCSTPKTCKTCLVTEGSASAHTYTVETVKPEALKSAATCSSAAVYYKSCSCGAVSTNDTDTFTSGDTLTHSYTVETVKTEALKSAATCTSAAVYYKSCSCGAVSTNDADTFTSGAPAAHSFTVETVKDEALKSAATTESAAVYYKSCSCGAISTNDADTFTYGAPLGHTHSFTLETVKNEAQKTPATCDNAAVYYKSCSCGAVGSNETDTFTSGSALGHKDEGKDHICDNGCGKNDMGACTDSDADSDHVCDYGCGKVLNNCTDVSGDNNHSCDVCGQENVSDHDYGNATCGTPATCSECGATTGGTAAHIYNQSVVKIEALKSPASCSSAAVYYKSCSCGAISTNDAATFTSGDPLTHKDENFDHVCDHGCGKNDMGDHVDLVGDNDHVCDYGCNVKISDCSDASGDGNHTCDECGNADITPHSYGSATCGAPATCSECGATTGTTLEHKDDNHDHICDNGCGKNDIGACTDSATDADHVCDYGNGYATGCKAVLNDCSDVNTDSDHACDVCGKANVSAHSYAENTTLAIEATCNAAATKTYECNCGHKYEETYGDALGHSITGVTPTERPVEGCDCEYVLVYICQNDNCDNKNKEVIGETVYHHNYVASIGTHATCSTPGQKTFKCSVCGDTSKPAEEILADATGHNWTTGNVVDGVRTDTCSICNATKTVMVSDSNSASSNASDLANTDVQLKVDDNTNANIQLGQNVADAIGDKDITISAGVVDKNTLENMGVSEEQLGQIGTNTVYDFNIKDGNGSPISDFGENNFVTITLPYELADGEDIDSIAVWFISDTCQVEGCDKGENCVEAHKLVSIEATYNNGFVTFQTNHFSIYTVTRLTPAQRCALYGHGYVCQHVEGSCTKDAYDLYVCVRCHDKYIDEDTLVVADGHDYTSDTHAATCTENGYILYSCNDCDHSYRTKLNATGHVWSVEDSDEASCVADGYTKYICTNDTCDEEYTVTYAKLAHVYTNTVVPATCTADGYTLHDCDNCEYSYTDTYVSALGHAYEPTTWDWAADYSSATLTFVCENDEEHTIVVNATIATSVVNGTCSNFVRTTYTATVSYNGSSYSDEKIVESGTTDHNFSSDWTKDENEHWHECVCGAKSDVAEHTFENATVTKVPTCKEAGESTATCACGETKVSVVPPTGEHNYVNGVCSACGKEESACDHSELHKESIDFGELGACDWILYYYTCECGEVKIIDTEHSDIDCDLDYEYEEDSYEDENGNTVFTMAGACSCGVEVFATAVITVDGCTETYVFDYTFKMNGEVIIENVGYTDEDTWHETTVLETIDLSKYGACGGSLIVYKCSDCGEITNVSRFEPDCDMDMENEPEVEQVTDENGVIHYIQKVECPDCDLALVVDMWMKNPSSCVTITYMTMTVSFGDTKIVELYDEDYDDNHEYEYDYELQGTTCEDGVKVTVHCGICGESYTYNNSGHTEIERNVEIDLSEHSSCGGSVIVDRCAFCGTITYVEDINIRCEMGDEVRTDLVNTDGDVIGYRYECTCVNCGLVFAEEEWIEQHSACKYTEYQAMYIYKDTVTIFQYVNDWYNEEHKYEYSVGDDFISCNQEHKVIARCTVCGETEEWWTSNHRYETREIDLSELGLCGGQIWEEYCPICNEILYVNVNDWCEWEYVEQTEDGHNKYQCRHCGAEKIEYVHEGEKDENCRYERAEIRSYLVNGEEVYGYERTYMSESHNYQYEYSLNGGTCEDGYYVTRYCPDCEHSETYENYGHRHASRELDLGEYGLCGGTIYEEYCPICNTVLQSGFNEKCYWVYVEETEDGYDKFECRRCGAIKLQYSFAGEKDENCCYEYTVVCAFIVDGEEVYRFETTYTREEHTYKYSYKMNGASCTDGVVMTTTCENCSIHWEETYYDHHVQLAERIDLGKHGACYGEYKRYSCACGEEGWVNLDCCADVWTNNEYFDDELGKMVYVEARTCEYCGLRFERSYYEVEDPDNCRITHYYTVVISIGNELIAETQYTSEGDYHSGYTTYELLGGEGSSCEDGVKVIFRCERCPYEDIYETYWHDMFVKESFELSEMGSVCGGHATLYGCACGERNEMSLEHDLCENGTEDCLLWIEDALTEGQETINGYNGIWNSSYIYICSVTDPADKACGFKIRYAYYWLKDENSCVAYRYETWQFGYDEETGTCEREVSFKTGGSMIYHNYEDNSVPNHVRFDCIDCESYYEEKYIYDGENQVGYEKRISNTLDNGCDKYYEYIEEYAFDEADRSWYTACEYWKYIHEDGSESWSENTISKYDGPFGENGRKVVRSACDRDGYLYEEEYAYVWYKGYEYTIYSVRTEGDYWYRYDYTYDLIDGCVRTTVYTDSDGETWSDEEDWCFFHKGHTITEPTCSQSGIGYDICVICEIHTDNYKIEPHDHDWIEVREGWYCCYRCGLENANGVSGDIIMEDLTEKYGNDENYVVGYYGRNDVEFTMFVALVWDDGREEIVEGLEFWTIDGIQAYAFSKAAVEAWANEKGFEGYKVKFSFVPVGSDSSFDYGVTFTETMHLDTITDDVSFVDYVSEGEWVSYTITPAETGTWTFTSDTYFDTYAELCDAEGNCIEYDDDGGEEANFMITYELIAGETYTIRVRWYSENRAGNMALVFAN